MTTSLVHGSAWIFGDIRDLDTLSRHEMLALAVLLGLASGGSLTLCYTIGGLMAPEAIRITAFGFFSGAAAAASASS